VQRGNQWASTSRVTNRVTGTTTRATQGSGGGEAVTRKGPQGNSGVARTGSGDVYAGRDGNVYKNDGSGWQKYDNGNGGWNNVEGTPEQRQQAQQRANDARSQAPTRAGDSSTVGQLDRDSAARAEGAQRTRDYSSSSARSGSSGSYRPSGGGARPRGGGGRRR